MSGGGMTTYEGHGVEASAVCFTAFPRLGVLHRT